MSGAEAMETMSPKLRKVAERARRQPQARMHSLMGLIDLDALGRAYRSLSNAAAVGVDGVSKEQYGQGLEQRLEELHQRLQQGVYRHQPIKRVHIPKEGNRTRPIGVSAIQDKVVQGALAEVLEAIYEQDFLACSYGYRPGRSAHQAVQALDRAVYRQRMYHVIEADIESFFDSLDRPKLKEMLESRIDDRRMMHLVGKCLHVGVLDGEEFSVPEVGTAQGSILSPLLGNIYLHHVLDRWWEQEVKPRLSGPAELIRFADDFVMAFAKREDAERVMKVLGRRMQKYGLKLHPDKTRMVDLSPPDKGAKGKGEGALDFLGFTFYWERSQQGFWTFRCKTRTSRLSRTIKRVAEYCRGNNHKPVEEQHRGLVAKLRGHYNYFGVNGNIRSLKKLLCAVERVWYKWLCRRSQRTTLNWRRFKALLERYPLPQPRISKQIWAVAT